MAESNFDILIIGGGPAGISAALTAHARGRRGLMISNPWQTNPLVKAARIENYPGLPGCSGRELLSAMTEGMLAQNISLVSGRVTAVMPFGGQFMASVGQSAYTGAALILAVGAALNKPYPGEKRWLGTGVSYCPTCDGMLYRGKKVAVIDRSDAGAKEAEFLRNIGCEVEYFGPGRGSYFEIQGEGGRVSSLTADGETYSTDGVFILRDTMAASVLLPSLALTAAGHIEIDGAMRTNIPGVFAAGDCTGRPYQIASAVGQGNLAALSADAYIKELEE